MVSPNATPAGSSASTAEHSDTTIVRSDEDASTRAIVSLASNTDDMAIAGSHRCLPRLAGRSGVIGSSGSGAVRG
jgi:hypothetical protein